MASRRALRQLLAVLLAALCAAAHALAASPRLRLFTVFAPPPANNSSNSSASVSAVLAMLAAAPVAQFASDFILIGEPLQAQAQPHVDSYDATNSTQILYQRPRWKLLDEGSKHEEAVPLTYARFVAVEDANATTCLAIAHWNASWNSGDAGDAVNRYAASLLASLNTSCAPRDVVALALSSPAASTALATLDPNATAADPLQLVEASHVLHQQQYVSPSVAVVNIPSAASSRLFVRMHSTMCADRAATLSGLAGGAIASTALALELCSGASCSICRPASFATTSATGDGDDPSRATKDKGDGASASGSSGSTSRSMVTIVACSLFLVAAVPVILVLFRHQFFAPAASTKEETELTTDLARVLRI